MHATAASWRRWISLRSSARRVRRDLGSAGQSMRSFVTRAEVVELVKLVSQELLRHRHVRREKIASPCQFAREQAAEPFCSRR